VRAAKKPLQLIVAAALALAATTAASPPTGALDGYWGGDRLQLLIEGSQARVEMDCASGTIAGPIRPDARGRFSASGTFAEHQTTGGPQRADEPPPASKATYSGEIDGETMLLSIRPADAASPQQYRLRKGVRVRLIRCL
jgi:hypothetical protein